LAAERARSVAVAAVVLEADDLAGAELPPGAAGELELEAAAEDEEPGAEPREVEVADEIRREADEHDVPRSERCRPDRPARSVPWSELDRLRCEGAVALAAG